MCYFVTAILPAAAELDSLCRLAHAHVLKLTEIHNPHRMSRRSFSQASVTISRRLVAAIVAQCSVHVVAVTSTRTPDNRKSEMLPRCNDAAGANPRSSSGFHNMQTQLHAPPGHSVSLYSRSHLRRAIGSSSSSRCWLSAPPSSAFSCTGMPDHIEHIK